jgi:hypothetical protein
MKSRAGVLLVLAVAGCGNSPAAPGNDEPPGNEETPGRLHINIVTVGTDITRFGYHVVANDRYLGRVTANATLAVDLMPGSYTIELGDLQTNCALQGAPPSALVAAGATAAVELPVTCTPLPSASGHIVWLRNHAIWMARPDMTQARVVIPTPMGGGRRWGLAVSRDGKWLAYTDRHADDPAPNIAVTTFNGDAPRILASSTFLDQTPEWTADGRLLFVSNRRGAGNDLWITDFDGSPPTLVAENVGHPRVSPDGTRILFTRPVSGHEDIHVMSLRGTGVTRLTAGDFYESEAQWSPDGSRIAFIAQPTLLHYDIYIMDADGSNRVRVTASAERVPTPDGGWDAMPRWSPDGGRLVFATRVRVGLWDVLSINLATGEEVRLIAEPNYFNQNPLWVP